MEFTRKITTLALVSLSVGAALNVSADERQATLYAASIHGVVPIQELQSLCTPGLPQPIQTIVTLGTGFYVLLDQSGPNSLWLVTARHVVERHADLLVKARIGSETKETAYMVLPRAKWIFHPSPTVQGVMPIDVAVMKVKPPIGSIAFRYCRGECEEDPTSKQRFPNDLDTVPEPTDHALFFGYPAGDVVPGELPPFVRSGIVAYAEANPYLKIDGLPLADESVFYIDAPSFGGNSGGPVMREPSLFRPKIQLFGLVTGSNPSRSHTIATSVTKIKETIDHAAKQTSLQAEMSWSKTPPSLPRSCKEQPS